MNRNELYHYGILGMKWGVRRYQNYDNENRYALEKTISMEEYNNWASKKK